MTSGLKLLSLGKCEKIEDAVDYLDDQSEPSTDTLYSTYNRQIAFDIILELPVFYLSCHITTTLLFKSLISLTKGKLTRVNEDTKFFSKHDINYCDRLWNQKYKKIRKTFFQKYVYDWNVDFKFSSRVVNAQVVGFMVIYYLFSLWVYYGIMLLDALQDYTSYLSI